MRITNYVASLTLCASLLGTPACARAEGDTAQKASIDELTQAEVDTLMQRSSVDEILKEEYQSGRVQKVKYENCKTNFRELVYQEHLSASQRKPVIMLVADGDGIGNFDKEKYGSEKGDAVVLKHYANNLRDFLFVVYDPSQDPAFSELGDGGASFGAELKREGISGRPSIAIYDADKMGKVNQFYVMKGGPKSSKVSTETPKVKRLLDKKIDELRKSSA